MQMPRGRVLVLVVVAGVVLGAGLVVALFDAGVPMPVAVATAALLICALAIVVAGVAGYRSSRSEGRGFLGSVGEGARASVRAVFELF